MEGQFKLDRKVRTSCGRQQQQQQKEIVKVMAIDKGTLESFVFLYLAKNKIWLSG